MRMTWMLMAASLPLLAACGDTKGTGDDRGAAAAAAAADELKQIEPGEYENSISITKFEIPGLPPEMMAEVRRQMEQTMAVRNRACVTAEEAAGGREERMRKLVERNGDCRVESIDVDGDKIEGRMVCRSDNGANGTMTFNGTMGPTSSDMAISTEMSDPAQPGVSAKIDMRVASRRVGDCPAGATTP